MGSKEETKDGRGDPLRGKRPRRDLLSTWWAERRLRADVYYWGAAEREQTAPRHNVICPCMARVRAAGPAPAVSERVPAELRAPRTGLGRSGGPRATRNEKHARAGDGETAQQGGRQPEDNARSEERSGCRAVAGERNRKMHSPAPAVSFW